ncbi:conserved hypothetical protein [Alkaliphilus metalliredigens QYMF]|uniref:Alcohol acetyltransferase n=1 Tax=Alkaliphilus metalliredigens (strain QYMF) TaxID=293826 RepID=A6TNE5_ALKMQ|nr:hypothetical protein [Alkaliphilus metalliredigens]ABR47713.1 conserved hypothetical protein [Alkaliphilus metalliredigens QYMF]
MKNWYRLDNAAKFFPAVTTKTNTSVFRLSMILTETVDSDKLQKAVDIVIGRFPTLAVKLGKGVFWNYLFENSNRLMIHEEMEYPCAFIDGYRNNGYLMRIVYYNHRIGLEVFHGLTDGGGAMEFLKTLIYQYLWLVGKDVKDEGLILLPEGTPDKLEEEDSYLRYYQHAQDEKFQPQKLEKAYSIKGTILEPYGINVTHGVVSASSLNQYARKMGTTITGYVASVLIQAIYLEGSKHRKILEPITIGIPVNLRGIFPSKTLRNFFAGVSVSVYVLPETKFEDIVKEVTRQMKENITKEGLSFVIAKNIRYEKMLGARFVPLFIKNRLINYAFKSFEGNAITMSLSNMGNIKLSKSMESHIDKMEAVLYPKGEASMNCGMCSVNDRLNITFARNIVETDIIKQFFGLIYDHTGFDIEVYSNDWGEKK